MLGPKLKDFKAALANGSEAYPELTALGKEVTEFARSFPTIGFTDWNKQFYYRNGFI